MHAAGATRRAHAKVNVFLRVMGRRPDGYHDVQSVVLPVSLHDVVTVRPAAAGGVTMTLHAVTLGEQLDERRNLATIAADSIAAAVFPDPSARPTLAIEIDKWIPFAAGLGGGSADAAATLLALDELYGCGLSVDRLTALGAEVGCDVPAMLAAEPVLVSGRGELLTPVHAATTWWVLAAFDFGISSADAYGWWDDEPITGPNPGVLIAALETGDVELLGDALFNDLQPGVLARHPQVGETIAAFVAAGALGAIVTGSGPTVAALARHLGHADALAAAVPGSVVVSGPPARGTT